MTRRDPVRWREVALPDYFVARWPVTVDQCRAFVDASGYGEVDPDAPTSLRNQPVVWLTWYYGRPGLLSLARGGLEALAAERLAAGRQVTAVERAFREAFTTVEHGNLPREHGSKCAI